MSGGLIEAIETDNLLDVRTSLTNNSGNIDTSLANGTTPLSFAARRGKSDIVEYLIARGATVNLKENANGCTPLSMATYFGYLEVVKVLISHGADINITDPYGRTPLGIAVQERDLDIVEYLLANDAATVYSGVLPLTLAIDNSQLEMVQLLLSNGVKQASCDLRNAIEKDFPKIVGYLIAHGAQLNEYIDLPYSSPLVHASELGHLDIVKALVEGGANINKTSSSYTPLTIAVQNKHLDVAVYLVKAGANVCKAGKKGKTPLSRAVENEDLDTIEWLLANGAEYTVYTAFLDAIDTGNLKIIKKLKEKGAVVNLIFKTDENDCGISPLMRSLDLENYDITKYLIENGAKVTEDLGKKETSYLTKFIKKGTIEFLKLLVENGANLNAFDEDGHTPLTKAVEMEKFEVVKYLIKQGTNVNQANNSKITPLMIAASKTDLRTFQFLFDFGADIDSEIMKEDQKASKEFAVYFQLLKHKIDEKKNLKQESNCVAYDGEATDDCRLY